MNPFKLKQHFRKISILVVIPYIILCITSGGLHSFDKGAFHAHALDGFGAKNEETEKHGYHTQITKSETSLCCNDHSSDNCDICRWLKSTTKRVQFAQKLSSIFQCCTRFFSNDHTAQNFIEIHTNSPRSPPFLIS